MTGPHELAALFKKLTHGVYVVGVAGDDKVNGFTAAWVMQVSFDPLLLALSINPGHSSYALMKNGGGFTVNVLGREHFALAERFGAPASVDKFAGLAWHPGQSGAPILADAIAWFDCELVAEHPAGDHVLALGRVINGAVANPGATPLSYADTGNLDGAEAIYQNLSFRS